MKVSDAVSTLRSTLKTSCRVEPQSHHSHIGHEDVLGSPYVIAVRYVNWTNIGAPQTVVVTLLFYELSRARASYAHRFERIELQRTVVGTSIQLKHFQTSFRISTIKASCALFLITATIPAEAWHEHLTSGQRNYSRSKIMSVW
jgi:hypothetical protein